MLVKYLCFRFLMCTCFLQAELQVSNLQPKMYFFSGVKNIFLLLSSCTCVQLLKVPKMQILNTQQDFPDGFAVESLRTNVARQPEVAQIAFELEY